MSKVELTKDQQEAVDSIKDFLKNPNQDVYTLTGVGGAGKTFSLVKAIEHYRGVIRGATVSHSAKVVLYESLQGRVNCVTIAQLLGLKRQIGNDGVVRFLPNPNPDPFTRLPIEEGDLFLIDECSMINDDQYMMILNMKPKNAKVIFIGDAYQLPPIYEDEEIDNQDSPTFNHTRAMLEQPVRYTGPISDLGNVFREEIKKFNEGKPTSKYVINHWMEGGERVSKLNEEGSGYIFLNDIEKAMEIATTAFKNNPEDSHNFRIIAFKNETIDVLNDSSRETLFGENLNQYEPGELVISRGGYGPRGEIYNNQIFYIQGMEKINGPSDIPCLSLKLSPEPPIRGNVFVVDNELGWGLYQDKLTELRSAAKKDSYRWRDFINFKEQFAYFDYSYALNSHKAQGRTFTDVLVFEDEILSIKKTSLKAKLQAMYVACTRAQRRVYIYNKNYRVDQSQLPKEVRKELGI